MTANTPEPEASSSSVPAQSQPTSKPVTNADTATQPTTQPAAAAPPPPAAASSATASSAAASPSTAGKGQPGKGQPAKASPTPPAKRVTPAGPRRSGGGGLAAAVAVASLLVAVGAIAIAVYALDVAREAKSQAAIAASANQAAANPPAPTATAEPSPTVAPTPTPTAPPFTAELSGAVLRIPPADSLCASVYVDVDTLQTGVYAGHEFYVSRCQGQHVVRVDRKDGAVPTGPNPTPETCAAQLNGAASAPEIVLDVRPGLTFCILTSKVDADQQGIPQRMAIVEVRAVGTDQSLATVVSTFRVPA